MMLRGEGRHCPDCATVTIFLPVGDHSERPDCDEWVCTACDGALILVPLAA